jgi:hypothetical protein
VNDHGRIAAWLVFVIVGACLLIFGAALVGVLDVFVARVVDLFA